MHNLPMDQNKEQRMLDYNEDTQSMILLLHYIMIWGCLLLRWW